MLGKDAELYMAVQMLAAALTDDLYASNDTHSTHFLDAAAAAASTVVVQCIQYF